MDEATFGRRLSELREAAGLTQGELSEKASIPQPTISQWEQGKREPGWFAVIKLAAALGVGVEAFAQSPSGQAAPRGRGRPPKSESVPIAAPQRRTGRKTPGKAKREN